MKILLFTVAMLIIQESASYAGTFIGKLFPYRTIDPYNVFLRKYIHHIVQMFFALFLLVIIKKLTKKPIGFTWSNQKTGLSYVTYYTILIGIVLLIITFRTYRIASAIRFAYPLTARNMIGSLSFQLFMSGPSEEILFRALPIFAFSAVFKKSIKIYKGISLECILAALLFSFAHMDSLVVNFRIVYAFVLGIVYGVTYQKTNSIYYPMMMHSISNVLSEGIGYLFSIFG
ncbi:MAG TPA: hypothetical protein DDZ89_03270 [Clostridiales bacterium]|nr:hypothetical protein [Clostridiales bacterium]